MNILVTGGAGFIGSHLVEKLIADGHEVSVWDDFSTGTLENLKHLSKQVYRCNDISVERISPEYHTDHHYEVIFHLAAEARIQPSFEKPLLVHNSNVTGMVKVLELARLHNSRVVFAGSSSVYHDMFANPYSFSKMIAEHYCTLYNRVYNVSVAIARFFNVYGPRQLEDGPYSTVIGVFERQKRENIPLTITGDGNQKRDFTHVSDIVNGLIAMSYKDYDAEVFDLGSGTSLSINEVAELFNHPVQYIPKRPGEAWSTLADIESTKRRLGYMPTRTLPEYVKSLGV